MGSKRKISGDYSIIDSSDDDLVFGPHNKNTFFLFDDDFEQVSDSDSSDSDIIPNKRKFKSESEESNDEVNKEVAESNEWVDVNDDISFANEFNTFLVGPQIPDSLKEPLEFFQLYFTDVLIESIITETNDYAKEKIKQKQLSKRSIWNSWTDVKREEFLAFLGVILNMGTMPLPDIQDYWSTRHNTRIPFYSEVFTRERFHQIFWMLRLKKQESPDRTIRMRIQKASQFLEYIDSKFSQYFVPNKDLCVFESVSRRNGKISFVTENPNKPNKRGVRIYVLADSETGYVYSILPYYGSVTSEELPKPELPLSSRIPLHFCEKLLKNNPGAHGYRLYTGIYYTSIPLADELLKIKCHLTGMIKANEENLPEAIKNPRFIRTKTTVVCKRNNTYLLAWKDKSVVTLLSTCDSSDLTRVESKMEDGVAINTKRPKAVMEYRKKMGGSERADQYAGTSCFLKKSLKWWRKLFFWGVEICVINSYVLYKAIENKNNGKPLTHSRYVKLLVDQLVGSFRQGGVKKCPPSFLPNAEERLDNKLHVLRSGTKKDCVVCSDRKIPGGRHETHTYCDTCTRKPRMHLGNCFERYHTLVHYKP